MNRIILPAALAALCLMGCNHKQQNTDKPVVAASSKPETANPKGNETAKNTPTKAKPEKLDQNGLEKIADSVKFTQSGEKDGKFTGKLENTSGNDIGMLEYDAFAYGKDDKLLEMIKGKYSRKLAAGKSVDLEVGPFKKAAGKKGVVVQVVVSWMNVNGTSWQRPVPKNRPKDGPNDALKK